MKVVSPRGYRTITWSDAAERYDPAGLLRRTDYRQPVRLYDGGLRVPGDLVAAHGPRECADNVIVDGDLVVDGLFDWWDDHERAKFFLVTGDVRANEVSLGGCVELVVRGGITATAGVTGLAIGDGPGHSHSRLVTDDLHARYVALFGHLDAVVRGDLTAEHGVAGRSYDDAGSLTVHGRTRAPLVLDVTCFVTTLRGPVEVGRHEQFDLPPEFDDDLDDTLDTLLVPEVHGDGRDTGEIWDLITGRLAAGEPVLRATPIG